MYVLFLYVSAAYGYPTLGRFSKASKENNTEMALINLSAPVNKHLNVGGMFAHVGVKWGDYKISKKNVGITTYYGFHAKTQ